MIAAEPYTGATLASRQRSKWEAALSDFRIAATAEDAYDAKHLDPYIEDLTKMPRPEDPIWEASQVLQDQRCRAEDHLMAIPSPDLTAFAIKFLIAFGGGRVADCWTPMLEAEATRFTGLEIKR